MRPTLWMFLKKKRKYALDYFSRHIIPRLVSADELTLLLDQHNLLRGSSPLISDALWMSLNPHLRKLNYRGTIEALEWILSLPVPYKFPPLTRLVIALQVRCQWPATPTASEGVLVTFLKSLEPTLESLSLRIPGQFASIFFSLPHFPRLEHLEIHLDTYQITLVAGVEKAFASFLTIHRECLRILSLSLYSHLYRWIDIYRDFCKISFPFLHTLVLGNPRDSVKLTQVFPHVPHLQSFVSGAPNLDEETMMIIRERASPSQPTIVFGRDSFGVELDVQLRPW